MLKNDQNLIWIDLEMTGLSVSDDHIIEIATVVTDSELEVIAEGPVIAIHQSEARLNKMDRWNTEHHTHSGLVARVLESAVDATQAEQETLHFLKKYVTENSSPMCGNSICQDRRFLCKEMPTLANYFHYRNLDVSTLKILAQRWAPNVAARLNKQSSHLALADIYDSIEELKFYRQHFLKF